MFALDGLDWRSWSAADRASVTFMLLKRQHKSTGDTVALRELYELVEDKAAIAELDRANMGQAPIIETTM